jgi:hypothetical protein
VPYKLGQYQLRQCDDGYCQTNCRTIQFQTELAGQCMRAYIDHCRLQSNPMLKYNITTSGGVTTFTHARYSDVGCTAAADWR